MSAPNEGICNTVCIVPEPINPKLNAGAGPDYWYPGRLYAEIYWALKRLRLEQNRQRHS